MNKSACSSNNLLKGLGIFIRDACPELLASVAQVAGLVLAVGISAVLVTLFAVGNLSVFPGNSIRPEYAMAAYIVALAGDAAIAAVIVPTFLRFLSRVIKGNLTEEDRENITGIGVTVLVGMTLLTIALPTRHYVDGQTLPLLEQIWLVGYWGIAAIALLVLGAKALCKLGQQEQAEATP